MLLVGVGAAASCNPPQLLLWALAGAIGGGVQALRHLPLAWTRSVCVLLALCGGVAPLSPIGLLMR
ncbi:hypothetical protein NZK33_15580 [Cyanobium sp. FGCU-6]|nr:hypothetical protein [Cyanobium sp. FGCU6]